MVQCQKNKIYFEKVTFKDKKKILCGLGLQHLHIQKEEINYKFENNYHIHNSYELEIT